MVYWQLLAKLHLTGKLINEKLPFNNNIPLFHHSIIPSAGQEIKPHKILLISISCRISETYKYRDTWAVPRARAFAGLDKGAHFANGLLPINGIKTILGYHPIPI